MLVTCCDTTPAPQPQQQQDPWMPLYRSCTAQVHRVLLYPMWTHRLEFRSVQPMCSMMSLCSLCSEVHFLHLIESSNQSLLSQSPFRSGEISSLDEQRVAQCLALSRCTINGCEIKGYQRRAWMGSSTPESLDLQRHHLKPEIGSLKQMKGRTTAWHSWLSTCKTH